VAKLQKQIEKDLLRTFNGNSTKINTSQGIVELRRYMRIPAVNS